ncbi:MAG: hypothetical protein IKE92_13705 [Clostridiales bacterium]|nr:hypothetical protein [Clostridiales bacterium]
MYESPIKIIYNNVEERFENGILKAVQQADIIVDREELVKALQYDRDSYRRGYMDGVTHENEKWTMRWHEVINLAPWKVDEMMGREEEDDN